MFKTNSYFNDKVISIAFENQNGPATVGVMAPGEYEFSTSKQEHMKVVSGSMMVKLPGKESFEKYSSDEVFIVEANCKFQVKIAEATAYLCLYK